MHFDFYTAPHGCSRVAHIALEACGRPYKAHGIYVREGANRKPDYLSLNPIGKLPLLIVDGVPLSQNVAILTFLARTFPEAGLLPITGDPFVDAQAISALAWCAADLHPLITRYRLPMVIARGADAHPGIKELAEVQLRDQLDPLERRLADQMWYFGEHWSIVDSYIAWIWFRLQGAGFPSKGYEHIESLRARADVIPAAERAMAKEVAIQNTLGQH